MSGTAISWLLLLLAGAMNGSFALPMKRMPHWRWENVWLVWSVLALIIFPLALAIVLLPHVLGVLSSAPVTTLACVVLCGVAWGVAQVLFGLSVAAIGIALTFSLVLGISAALGAAVPFLTLHAALLFTRVGAFLSLGLATLAAGMVLCARAGMLRDRTPTRPANDKPISRGLALAILSGFCASAMNVGFSFAAPLSEAAVRQGASKSAAAIAVWLPLLLGGALPNVLYTTYLLRREHSAPQYATRNTGYYWWLAACMGFLWFASTMLYGVASTRLGDLGPVLGWPVFMAIVVITASFVGWRAGEWEGSGVTPLRTQATGVGLLVVAAVLLSRALV